MYIDRYSGGIVKKLAKLRKKDTKHYKTVRKKMDQILVNHKHRYKDLHYSMKRIKRVRIGHFVLVFTIDHAKKEISFEDYEHHDKIYI